MRERAVPPAKGPACWGRAVRVTVQRSSRVGSACVLLTFLEIHLRERH